MQNNLSPIQDGNIPEENAIENTTDTYNPDRAAIPTPAAATPEEIEPEQQEQQEDIDPHIFRFLSMRDLYTESCSMQWLINPYLDQRALAMLFGESGSMKTFIALDMGLCIATGKKWQDHPVNHQGAVFYICGEGKSGILRRLEAWEKYHGISLADVPFFVSDRPVPFLDEKSAQEVVAAVDELAVQCGKPALVIIDTLNRNFGNGDENDTPSMTKFVSSIDKHLRIPYGCTVLIIHHTGHKEKKRPRGAYALYAALDWVYLVEKKQAMILQLTNVKAKDSEPPPSIRLKAQVTTLDRTEEDGKPITSLILISTTESLREKGILTGANKIAYDALVGCIKDNGGNPVSVEIWRAAAFEANISPSKKIETKRKAFKRAKDYLLEIPMIETKDGYWMPVADKGQLTDI